jgi:hypothetical protein
VAPCICEEEKERKKEEKMVKDSLKNNRNSS